MTNFPIATVIIFHSFCKTSTPKSFTFKNSLFYGYTFFCGTCCQLLHTHILLKLITQRQHSVISRKEGVAGEQKGPVVAGPSNPQDVTPKF